MTREQIKGLTNAELRAAVTEARLFIDRLEVNLSEIKYRKTLLDAEIYNRAAKEMTLEQIEKKLGHKVVLKDG